VAVGQVFFQELQFSAVSIIPPMLHVYLSLTLYNLSSLQRCK
jgi:hypothetical protein